MMEMSLLNQPGRHGLRRVKIPRYQNGFGFTLRHFIVYPPEIYANDTENTHGEQRHRMGVVKVTEPVDTIFVKSIVQHGPADCAGLCVGDRIISVNGQTIFGKSYDQVVQLIQKSHDTLRLEVCPKQYDTLQVFFEETAYRPETNQRPYSSCSSGSTQTSTKPIPNNHYGSQNYHPSSGTYPYDRRHTSNNSSESFFLDTWKQPSMSSTQPSSSHSNPQLFSHLPRPTPYNSSVVWSNTGVSQQRKQDLHAPSARPQYKIQPQTYYPFNHDDLHQTQPSTLWKIKEEPNTSAKSAESILANAESKRDYADYYGNAQRSGSMECLAGLGSSSQGSSSSSPWNRMGPGYRYSVAADGNSLDPSSHRRESTGSLPNNSLNSMVVTMSSRNSNLQGAANACQYNSELDAGMKGLNSDMNCLGYETKMVDRIRKSCEQKEEFLKRPNQPLPWAPLQTTSANFPKELYAQPQKFEKIPWPPAHMLPTVTSAQPPVQSLSESSPNDIRNLNNVSVVSVQHYPEARPDNNVLGNEHEVKLRSQVQKSSSVSQYQPRSISPSWMEYGPRNRTTIVGSRKLHCDPPPDWKPDLASLTYDPKLNESKAGKLMHSLSCETDSRNTSEDAEVVRLRNRNLEADQDNERLVRRVSYLKATSSPIDMDRKSTSPTSPTRSFEILGKSADPNADGGRRRSVANKLSAEFLAKGRIIRLRQFFEDRTQPPSIFRFSIDSPISETRGFGSFQLDKNPDSSEITLEGQVYYKIRVGESKRGGYHRSWRQGWAQIRRSGCLYISKEKLGKDAVVAAEDSVIIALSLRIGVCVEQAEDYVKRKHVFRIKTTYTPDENTNLSPDASLVCTPSNPHPPPSTSVEILIQAEDINDFTQWINSLHSHLENNNYCNGNSNSFKGIYFGPDFGPKQKSLLTSFLPSPVTSFPGQAQSTDKGVININNNSLSTTANSVGFNNAVSPKNKTWKNKVARQWKKVHNIIDTSGDSKVPSQYSSLAPAGATFGIIIENCPPGENNPLIPRVIEYAVEVVEKRGIDMVGLYRIPGNNASVATLTDRLNKGEDPNPDKDQRWLDVHVVASLIKSFLRRLPDPLLTDERYTAFITAADDPDPDSCLEKLQMLISDLPDSNYETLRTVVLHLKNVAEHGETNRMDARNLAIVFGPTIVRTAEENVTSMVADMKNQCKIVEYLILNAEELFKERRLKYEGVSPPEFTSVEKFKYDPPSLVSVQMDDSGHTHTTGRSLDKCSPPLESIENEIKASVLKAAMRKTSQTKSPPLQNVYGLPTKLNKNKPIDDAGFIRSYSGLNEETEQRVRKFELETRAMLSREDRSPHSSLVNVVVPKPTKGIDDLRIHRLKLDDELQRAKDDLEKEDIYDQLADDPSRIIHHRDQSMFPVLPGNRNLSSSSLSSSNSNAPSSYSISKFVPCSYKPLVPQSLPPKPPSHSSGSSLVGPISIQSKSSVSSSSSPISPIRRVNSLDRLGSDFDVGACNPSAIKNLDISKYVDRKLGPLPFAPKHFGGSLDSLKDIANGNDGPATNTSGNGLTQPNGINASLKTGGGLIEPSSGDFSPRSSDGSDLVTMLSKTLDKKLKNLRRSQDRGTTFSSLSSSNNFDSEETHEECVKSPQVKSQESDLIFNGQVSNGLVNHTVGNPAGVVIKRKCIDRRRNSMIERTVNQNEDRRSTFCPSLKIDEDQGYYRNPSLHRSTEMKRTTDPRHRLTKEAKTATNKLKRDNPRRHSLGGTSEILNFAFGGRGTLSIHDKHHVPCTSGFDSKNKTLSNDAIASALNTSGILESHV